MSGGSGERLIGTKWLVRRRQKQPSLSLSMLFIFSSFASSLLPFPAPLYPLAGSTNSETFSNFIRVAWESSWELLSTLTSHRKSIFDSKNNLPPVSLRELFGQLCRKTVIVEILSVSVNNRYLLDTSLMLKRID